MSASAAFKSCTRWRRRSASWCVGVRLCGCVVMFAQSRRGRSQALRCEGRSQGAASCRGDAALLRARMRTHGLRHARVCAGAMRHAPTRHARPAPGAPPAHRDDAGQRRLPLPVVAARDCGPRRLERRQLLLHGCRGWDALLGRRRAGGRAAAAGRFAGDQQAHPSSGASSSSRSTPRPTAAAAPRPTLAAIPPLQAAWPALAMDAGSRDQRRCRCPGAAGCARAVFCVSAKRLQPPNTAGSRAGQLRIAGMQGRCLDQCRSGSGWQRRQRRQHGPAFRDVPCSCPTPSTTNSATRQGAHTSGHAAAFAGRCCRVAERLTPRARGRRARWRWRQHAGPLPAQSVSTTAIIDSCAAEMVQQRACPSCLEGRQGGTEGAPQRRPRSVPDSGPVSPPVRQPCPTLCIASVRPAHAG